MSNQGNGRPSICNRQVKVFPQRDDPPSVDFFFDGSSDSTRLRLFRPVRAMRPVNFLCPRGNRKRVDVGVREWFLPRSVEQSKGELIKRKGRRRSRPAGTTSPATCSFSRWTNRRAILAAMGRENIVRGLYLIGSVV